MPRSVATRLTLWYVAVLAAVLGAVGAVADLVLARRLDEGLDASLHSALRVISLSLRHEIEEHDNRSAGEIWFRAMLGTLHQVTFATQGIAVFDGRRLVAAKPGSHGYLPTPPQDASGSEAAPQYATARAGRSYRVVSASVPVPAAGTVYTIAVGESLEATDAAVSGFRLRLLLFGPALLLLTGAGGYLLVRRTLAPVLAMSEAVDRITARDLGQRLPTGNPHDELGRLAATFNRLLERLHAAFEQQRRFMADASHELRTPVSIVRTAAQVTLGSQEPSIQDYRQALTLIQGHTWRLSGLVNDMMLLARADAGVFPVRKQDFYLDELVRDSAQAAGLLGRRKGVTVTAATNGEALCYADEGLVRQALLILLDNAVKFTPTGGSVRVALEGGPHEYRVEVADSGPGVPAEAQPYIFERFYRANTARSQREGAGTGAGLGLSIAKWIAGAHRGTLELAQSGPGGSVFRLSLPVN